MRRDNSVAKAKPMEPVRAALPRGAQTSILVRDVTVEDPIMIHTNPLIMLQHIRTLFEGVCHNNMLILNVVGVISVAPAEIDYGANIGSGHAMVQFKANVLNYVEGDVVAGFVIAKKDANIVQARLVIGGEVRVFVTIAASPLTESLKIDQTIIVRFTRLTYLYGLKHANGIADLYVPSRTSRVYQCGEAYVFTVEAENMLERLKELQNELKNIPKWERYRDIIYPWDSPQQPPRGSRTVKIEDLASHDNVLPAFIARDSRLRTDPSSAHVCAYDNGASFPGDYVLIQGTPMETVIIDLIRSEIEALILLLDIASAYSDATFSKHANLWTVMRSAIDR